MNVSERKIRAFVNLKKDWVVSAKNKVEGTSQATKKHVPYSFKEGTNVPYKGQLFTLKLKPEKEKTIAIEIDKQDLILYLPSESIIARDLIKQFFIIGIKKQALIAVEAYVDQYAQKQGLHPRFIRIKTQKSRWGSCGIHNDININWLLMLAPPEVMEYVVVHEICHIRERNHSHKFWRLVEAHLPNYQQQRNWLKKNGHDLMQGL